MDNHRKAYSGILLLGLVSLIGDVVYEGSRGIVPGYLEFLGATGLIVGLVGGLGDFLGYAARLASGFLADTTHAYWLFTFLGYGLIVSIPLLGVAGSLQIAIILVLLERFGKAIRSPARDTILSFVSKDIGAGKAFGIHELMDQLGAILGPLMVTFLLLYKNDYSSTFIFLFIPFSALLLTLLYAYKRISVMTVVTKEQKSEDKTRKLGKAFYVYVFAVLLNTIGLIPYGLILFKATKILEPINQQWMVPLLYLLIQGIDAPAALASGFAYDKYGLKVLVVPFLLSLIPPLLTMVNAGLLVLIGAAAVFGLVLGMQESVYRAAVSQFTPLSSRGTAYGIFNTAYGVGFLVSGAIFGLFIDYSISFIIAVAYVLVMQLTAIFLLHRALHQTTSST